MKAVLRHEPHDINLRLDALGLTTELLRQAVAAGEMDRSSCTPNHPFFFAGLMGWGGTVKALRDNLAVIGWKGKTRRGVDLVLSPDDTTAIAVASADEWTGRLGGSPKTNSSKGSGTVAAIERNRSSQMWLAGFEPMEEAAPEPGTTWYLLIHSAVDEVRCELSLPTQMGDDGRIDSWAERIILEPVGAGTDLSILPGADDQPDVEVSISRKDA